ncbi:MAG: hypothetical protein ACOYJJ_02840 [Anaerovoracaceae bacterium]|jgi:hypothetical protein
MEMKEKEIRKAMNDSDYFKTLEPAEMLHVLVRDVVLHGDCKKKNFEIFNAENRVKEITQEQKTDELVDVIMLAKPQQPLRDLQRMGFIRFLIDRCFYSMKMFDKRTYYAMIDNFDKLEQRDPAFRVNFFFFPFDPKISYETFQESNFDPDTSKWMFDIIDNYEEFKLLRSEVKLKRFITKWGLEFYYYMDEYADAVLNVTGLKKDFGRYTSRSYVDRWVSKGHPLFVKDLKVTDEELIAAGVPEPELTDTKKILLEHCYTHPSDNNRGMLIKVAQNVGVFDKLKMKLH